MTKFLDDRKVSGDFDLRAARERLRFPLSFGREWYQKTGRKILALL
jgi:hypothetical protein